MCVEKMLFHQEKVSCSTSPMQCTQRRVSLWNNKRRHHSTFKLWWPYVFTIVPVSCLIDIMSYVLFIFIMGGSFFFSSTPISFVKLSTLKMFYVKVIYAYLILIKFIMSSLLLAELRFLWKESMWNNILYAELLAHYISHSFSLRKYTPPKWSA